jgi:hypothetical protein
MLYKGLAGGVSALTTDISGALHTDTTDVLKHGVEYQTYLLAACGSSAAMPCHKSCSAACSTRAMLAVDAPPTNPPPPTPTAHAAMAAAARGGTPLIVLSVFPEVSK